MSHLILSPIVTVGSGEESATYPQIADFPGVEAYSQLIDQVTLVVRIECDSTTLAAIQTDNDYTVLLENCWDGTVAQAVQIAHRNAFKFVPYDVQRFITVLLENGGPTQSDYLGTWQLRPWQAVPVALQSYLDGDGYLPVWLLLQCQEGEPFYEHWQWLFAQEMYCTSVGG